MRMRAPQEVYHFSYNNYTNEPLACPVFSFKGIAQSKMREGNFEGLWNAEMTSYNTERVIMLVTVRSSKQLHLSS